MNNVINNLKANKAKVVKRTLIVVGVAATIVVAGALYVAVKSNTALDELETAEV